MLLRCSASKRDSACSRQASLTPGSGTSGTPLFLFYDAQGSTRLLLDSNLDNQGTYTYDAYGDPIGFDPITVATDVLYTGQRLDPLTGQYDNRARDYDPSMGTFTTLDSYAGDSTHPLSYNKYLYTQGDPVNGFDPSGLDFDGGGAAVMNAFAAAVGPAQPPPPPLPRPPQPPDPRGTKVVSPAGDYRELTIKEQKLITYVYEAAMPDEFVTGPGAVKNSLLLATLLNNVTIWDYGSMPLPNPLANWAIAIKEHGAFTLGNDEYFRSFPSADSLSSIADVVHETLHAYQAASAGGKATFATQYAAEGALAEWFYGYGQNYKMNKYEIQAYAIEDTVGYMLRRSGKNGDGAEFKDAFESGTESQLPASMKVGIRNLFQHCISKKYAEHPMIDYDPAPPAFP